MESTKSLMRKAVRLKVDGSARLFHRGRPASILRLNDVSMFGLSGVTTSALETGDQVEIFLDKPEVNAPVSKTGRVAWSRVNPNNTYSAGFSLGFLDLDNFSSEVFAPQLKDSRAKSMFSLGDSIEPPVAAFETLMRSKPASTAAVQKPAKVKEFRYRGAGYKKVAAVSVLIVVLAVYSRNLPFMSPVWSAGAALRGKVSKVVEGIHKSLTLTLDGVIYDPAGTSVVTINGRVLMEGQTHNDITIKKINRDSVVIETRSGKEKVINLIPDSA